ncbi:PT domain-containing protein [Cryobacterium sp. Sr8]|uniref:PT domain-containing protein n=1 Tax=Cryobacterium sp. Sr8 TaxID=1259203 RepID=UPI00106B197F|nr:PT domain-containing protein [Cryobacterium sp. Sr8]
MARGIASVITGGIAWVIENTSFNTDSYLWTAAVSEWAWWSWVVLIVILIAGIVAIMTALWSRDSGELTAAIIRFFLAVPLSAASLWLVGSIVNVVDQLVDPLLTRGGNGEGLYRTVENIIYGGGLGNIWLAQLVLTLLVVGVVVLVFVFSFRNLALAALVALGPVAFMLFPMKIGVHWVIRWFSAVIALILTTPLTLGFLMLVLKGFAEVDSMWSIQALPLGLGMIMIAFAPVAVFGLFSFVGQGATSAIDNIASRGGSTAKQGGSRAARSLSSAVASRTAAVRRRTPASSGGPGPRAPSGPARNTATRTPTAQSTGQNTAQQGAQPKAQPSAAPTTR